MKINPQAICARKKYPKKQASAMFKVNIVDKSILKESHITIGPFKRRPLFFVKEGKTNYLVCSSILK